MGRGVSLRRTENLLGGRRRLLIGGAPTVEPRPIAALATLPPFDRFELDALALGFDHEFAAELPGYRDWWKGSPYRWAATGVLSEEWEGLQGVRSCTSKEAADAINWIKDSRIAVNSMVQGKGKEGKTLTPVFLGDVSLADGRVWKRDVHLRRPLGLEGDSWCGAVDANHVEAVAQINNTRGGELYLSGDGRAVLYVEPTRRTLVGLVAVS